MLSRTVTGRTPARLGSWPMGGILVSLGLSSLAVPEGPLPPKNNHRHRGTMGEIHLTLNGRRGDRLCRG